MRLVMLPFVGLLIGTLTVLFGGGGGLLYTGVLTACFGMAGPTAASCSLATMWPTLLIGSYSHWKRGNLRLQYGTRMALAGVLGCLPGTLWSMRLSPSLYQTLLAIVLLVSAAAIVRRPGKGSHTKQEPSAHCQALVLGWTGGALAGIFGMSGSPPIVGGLACLGLGAAEMIGTSVFVLAAISLAGFLMHWRSGMVDWTTTALLLAGTLLGAWLAPLLLHRIRAEALEKWFRPLVTTVLVMTAFLLIRRALF